MVGYLKAQALANPQSFLPLLGKVLPLQVAGQGPNGEVEIAIDITGLSAPALREVAALKIAGW